MDKPTMTQIRARVSRGLDGMSILYASVRSKAMRISEILR